MDVAASLDPAGSGRDLVAVNATKGPFELIRHTVGILGGELVPSQLLRCGHQLGVDRKELAQQLAALGKRKLVERRSAGTPRSHVSPQAHPAGRRAGNVLSPSHVR